jgi:hypothetical protein
MMDQWFNGRVKAQICPLVLGHENKIPQFVSVDSALSLILRGGGNNSASTSGHAA